MSSGKNKKKSRAGMPGPVPPNSALLPEMPHRLKSKQIQDSSRFLELPRGDIFTNYRPRQTPVLPETLLLKLVVGSFLICCRTWNMLGGICYLSSALLSRYLSSIAGSWAKFSSGPGVFSKVDFLQLGDPNTRSARRCNQSPTASCRPYWSPAGEALFWCC